MATRKNKAVWMEKYGRWQINVQKDGVRKSFTSRTKGRAGQDECHRKADAWLSADAFLDASSVRVSDAYDKWISELQKTTSYDHWYKYKNYGKNYILPIIGAKKTLQIDKQMLQGIINTIYAERNLSYKTLSNVRGCITGFMKYCRENKWATITTEDISIPKSAQKGRRKIYLPDDLRKLFSSSKTIIRGQEVDDFYIHAYRTQVLSGLRPGELIALKRSNDVGYALFLDGSINVRGKKTSGKNDNARRSVTISNTLRGVLDAQYAMLQDNGVKSDYIFCKPDGEPLSEKLYRLRLHRYSNHNGITDVTAYELRHTFVSAAKTLPEGVIKPLVGHSQSMDTYGVYSHEMTDDNTVRAQLLDDTFSRILSKK